MRNLKKFKKHMFFLGVSNISLSMAHETPNIILIVADDLGYADMSFLPQSAREVHTPNIDRLALQGVYFEQAYATCPVSSPARAGLITGRYQQRWGNYWFGQGGVPQGEVTIAEYLKRKGYYTVKVGKTHHNGKELDHPKLHGFDEFFGFLDHTHSYVHLSYKDVKRLGVKAAKQAFVGPLLHNDELVEFEDPEAYTTTIFTEKAVQYIKDSKRNKTLFFLFLSYNAVHIPTYQHTPSTNKAYGLSEYEEWNPQKESFVKWHERVDWKNSIDLDRRKRYLACLELMDKGIGRVLDTVENDRNTIVIFLSDNGGTHNTEAYNTPLSGHKYQFKEGGVRIPLIASCPERWSPGINKTAMVSAMDIVPTLLDIVGVHLEEGHLPDGKSLLPLLEKRREEQHDVLFFDGGWAWAVRKGEWKLIHIKENRKARNYEDVKGDYLFNQAYDIREENNLADKYPEIVSLLRDRYNVWRKDKPEALSPEEANVKY